MCNAQYSVQNSCKRKGLLSNFFHSIANSKLLICVVYCRVRFVFTFRTNRLSSSFCLSFRHYKNFSSLRVSRFSSMLALSNQFFSLLIVVVFYDSILFLFNIYLFHFLLLLFNVFLFFSSKRVPSSQMRCSSTTFISVQIVLCVLNNCCFYVVIFII